MKKNLLLAVLMMAALALNAQKVWNFSAAPYGASPTVNFAATFVDNGLTVATDGTALWSMDANAKTIDGVAYTTRLKSGGGGGNVLPSRIPVTRYLSINVSGNSEIKFGMISSSSTASRTLILVNEGETFLDSIVNIPGTTASTYTYNYTGGATKLYFYSRASGLNFYYLSATNVVSSVNSPLADKGVTISTSEILNTNKMELEVYSVLGKKVLSSTENISLNQFKKGVYVVRVAGTNQSQKFTI